MAVTCISLSTFTPHTDPMNRKELILEILGGIVVMLSAFVIFIGMMLL